MRETSEGRILSELNAITSLVSSYGTRELRREYLRRGNVHRDWNLERIARTPRRRLTLHARGAPLGVELSCWWEPEQVTLAYATPGGRPILVTSVGISHVELLRASSRWSYSRKTRQPWKTTIGTTMRLGAAQ